MPSFFAKSKSSVTFLYVINESLALLNYLPHGKEEHKKQFFAAAAGAFRLAARMISWAKSAIKTA